MDETSIPLIPFSSIGAVAPMSLRAGAKAVDACSLSERRSRFTLMCTICTDTRVQPCLPQVLLSNGRILGQAPKVEGLSGNFLVWTQKSAWASHATFRKYLAVLGTQLAAVAPSRDYFLLVDCAPCQLDDSIVSAAKSHGIRLMFIPASLTRVLQPCDTALFGHLKNKFSELYRLQKTQTSDGKIKPMQWLRVLSDTLQAVLPAVKWSHAFCKVGALNSQRDVSQACLAEFGWETLPEIPPVPPTMLEAQSLFPKGRKLDFMSYILWKRPSVRFHKGKVIKTID